MNNSDRWVSHNLQRQRELLERQRQRRLQANFSTVSRTANEHFQQQQHSDSPNTMTRSGSGNITGNIFSMQSKMDTNSSTAEVSSRPMQSRGSLYSFVSSSPSPAGFQQQQVLGDRENSAAAGYQFQQFSSTTTKADPKIITVKGITPPPSPKRNGEGSGSNQKMPRKPVLNVDHLEPLGQSFCSEADEEERAFRGLNIQYGGEGPASRHSQRSPSSTTALASKRPSWNEDVDEDEGSIPTEILNEEPLEAVDLVDNLEQFVMDPVRKNHTLKCRITRDKRGMDKGMYPVYYLHMEKNDGRRLFLLAARRRKKSTTANYLISIDPTDLSRNGRSFIAKVRSNAVGTMFTIYDSGENPKKSTAIGEGVRRELGAIIYDTNVLGLKGPRKMTIIIPGIYVDQKHNYVRPLAVRPISERDSILERHKSNRLDEMVILSNKQPVWNEDTQSYVLNFHGRVTQASVKNFQIVHSMNAQSMDQKSRNSLSPDPNEYIIMQFGRIDSESFTMDVRYPLSPVQAFGIAMSSFHGKLACE